MNKILIEVTSPAAEQSYDMLVPDNMQVGEFATLVNEVFSKISNGIYRFNGSYVVSEKVTGSILKPEMTMKESNIRNGSKLILY
ncbi:MAG: hypothetical protein IJE14_01735 [Clostridia bacterium]|nr:hypothetical protein [Clostridia bacterium]